MSKHKGNSYLGGHTVLTQRRGDFEQTLSNDARKYQERKHIAQAKYDRELKETLAKRDKLSHDSYDIIPAPHLLKRQRESLKMQIRQANGKGLPNEERIALIHKFLRIAVGPSRRKAVRLLARLKKECGYA